MVNLFDSHAHLDDEMFDADREQVIENIKNSGVKLVTNIASSIKTSYQSVDLAEKYDFIYATAGVHPSDVYDMTDSDLDTIEKLSMHKKVVAIGEIGLDYHYDGYDENQQKHWFLKQLKLAEKLDMPVVVHSRDAAKDTMDILKSVNTEGIIHCYSGSAEMAKEYIDMGYYISFTGTVTYKNAKTAVKVASEIPLERLLIETDSPYLSPDGFRGTRNDSSRVRYVCEKIAQLRGISPEQLADITYENAKRVYRIDNQL